jgi:hypothetical protein
VYGLVNRAVEELVRDRHGDAMWQAVKQHAGVQQEMFVAHDSYPDDMTYRLVAAASTLSGEAPNEILEAFGRHWVTHTARHGYADMMRAAGATLRDFLRNLPDFHTRVALLLPALDPPQFAVTDLTERSLLLHYRTHRPGLAPFVVGLLHGLGEMYATPVHVVHVAQRDAGADHDAFQVEWDDPSAA